MNSLAFNLDSKKVKFVEDCELYLRYQGADKLAHYTVFEDEEIKNPAYCLNPEYNGVGSDGILEYNVNVDNKLEDESVWKVLINGYPYKTLEELGVENEKEAYTATQFAVYTILHNRNPEDYTPIDSSAGKRTYQAYLKIVNWAKESIESVNKDVEINIVSDSNEWMIDSEDGNYLSKTYNLNTKVKSGSYKISFSGNLPKSLKLIDIEGNEKNKFELGEKFKIIILIEDLKEDFNFEINAIASLNTKPIGYGKTTIPETQNYALTGYIYEDSKTIYQEIVPKNSSKIEITKQEKGTGKRLEGVEFNLLNSTKDIVIQNLVTDKNGQIILEQIEPGLYYLQEIKTLENYNVNTELIEIDLQYNEKIELIVENSKIEELKIEKPKVEIIKRLPVTGY